MNPPSLLLLCGSFATVVTASLLLAGNAGATQPVAAVSVASQPSATGAGHSFAPAFSADGRFVAFLSHANNLVTNDDLAPHLDLFRRDLVTSHTVLVSVNTNGIGGGNDSVGPCALSLDARFIAFETAASNLVPGYTHGTRDIYVRDLLAGTTTMVSVSADGLGSGNGPSFSPLLSADGRYVVFESASSNLVTNDFNGANDIFIRDLVAGVTTLVSLNAEGTASAEGVSHSPSISSNGLFVAFVSHATNLTAGVTNRLGEIYVRDVAAGTNRWAVASHLWPAREAVTHAYIASDPVLDAEGRFVAFKTAAGSVLRFDTHRPTNSVFVASLAAGFPPHFDQFSFWDNPRVALRSPGRLAASPLAATPDGRYVAFTTGTNDGGAQVQTVMRADFEGLVTNVAILPGPEGTQFPYNYNDTNVRPSVVVVSTNFGGFNAQTNHSYAPTISADGRRLLFLSQAPNAPGALADGLLRLYSRDMDTHAFQVISTNRNGRPAVLVYDLAPVLAPNGALAAWETDDSDMVAGDQNASFDVFARDLATGAALLVSAAHPALPAVTGRGISAVGPGALSGNGSRVAFHQYDSSLRSLGTNRWTDVVLRDLGTGTSLLLSANFPVSNIVGFALNVIPPTNQSSPPQISADGRYVVFGTGPFPPFNLSGTGRTNIFWRDLQENTNRILTGESGSLPSMSADGLIAAFESRTAGLAPFVSDNNSSADIFVYAREAANSALQPVRPFALSTTPSRNSTADNHSINPIVSSDGRWVAYQSVATNLTSDPFLVPSVYQLFATRLVRDPTNTGPGSTRLVSYSTAASPAFSGRSTQRPWPTGATNPVFSADSRYAFYKDGISNVIYRHDCQAADVVTITPHPEPGGTIYFTNIARVTNLTVCADCANPSPDFTGRLVAFESPAGANATRQIWLRDILTGSNELISANPGGADGGNGPSFMPLLSCDARFVVFASKASDLVANDANRATDIFVRDLHAGVTHCLSLNRFGSATANRLSSSPVLSPDGRTVAFQSFASDLVPGDYNDTRDVFVVSLAGPDIDGDGLDDDWEVAYFNDLARDGSGDFDHDGASDAQEFRAGTDPTNTGSILRVLTLTTAVGPQGGAPRTTTIFWASTPFRSYRVQFKDGDVNAPWTDLPGDVLATGTTASKTHVTFVGAPPRAFYRVRLIE